MEHKSIEEIRREIDAQILRVKEPLFTSKASPDPDWYLNACLHISGGDWDTYAMGYKRAGDILVQYVVDNDWDQDFLVYPIAFLYRQYLELRLKELIFVSSRLLDQDARIPKTHNLVSLWRQARPNIEAVWTDSETKGHLNAVEDRLGELCDVDSGSYAFRYPEDKEGTATLTGMVHINLKQLRDVIQGISHVLDGSSTGMGEYLNAKHEMMAEYRAEMRREYGEY
jgi:hypothetical protein